MARIASKELEYAERQKAAAEKALEEWQTHVSQGTKKLKDAEIKVAAFQTFDTVTLEEQIADAEQINSRVRDNQAHKQLKAEEKRLAGKVDALTAAIDKADATKAERIAKAKMPVKGLGLDEAGVTFNGMPFEQCSSAEQLRISVAMGLALNPKIKVLLIRDGSLLDDESLRALAEQAAEADAQVWVERVGRTTTPRSSSRMARSRNSSRRTFRRGHRGPIGEERGMKACKFHCNDQEGGRRGPGGGRAGDHAGHAHPGRAEPQGAGGPHGQGRRGPRCPGTGRQGWSQGGDPLRGGGLRLLGHGGRQDARTAWDALPAHRRGLPGW